MDRLKKKSNTTARNEALQVLFCNIFLKEYKIKQKKNAYITTTLF